MLTMTNCVCLQDLLNENKTLKVQIDNLQAQISTQVCFVVV